MQLQTVFPKYVEALLAGNRSTARDIIRKTLSTGVKAHDLYRQILFPAMERIDQLYREDTISIIIRNLATRINRFLTDQIQSQLVNKPSTGKSAVIVCAESEVEELGGQMCADLLESEGWQCFFLGGGVPEDEVTEFIGTIQPQLLIIYGSTPSGVPVIKELVHRIREIGLCPLMNVMLTGGIFNRVEGLWEELQADLYATDPVHVITMAQESNQRMHVPQDPMAPKRRRRLVAGPISIN
jgi:MerR family transcriptional regulator, light-induced transcriptional regulator